MLLSTLLLATGALAQNALSINTPSSLVQCQPVQLQWSNGRAPFYVAAIPAGQTAAAPLARFPAQQGNAFTWVVNLRAGTEVTIKVTDASGTTAYASALTVQEGFDDSCLTASNATTTAANGAATTAPAAGTSPAATEQGTATASPTGNTSPAASPSPAQTTTQGETATPAPTSAASTIAATGVPLLALALAMVGLI